MIILSVSCRKNDHRENTKYQNYGSDAYINNDKLGYPDDALFHYSALF